MADPTPNEADTARKFKALIHEVLDERDKAKQDAADKAAKEAADRAAAERPGGLLGFLSGH